jgi:UrcA family protein
MKSRNYTLQILGCTVALLLSSVGAVAQAPANINLIVTSKAPLGDVLQRTVTYGDLNLDHRSGVKALHRRLERAVAAVCNPFVTRDLSKGVGLSKCKSESMAAAVQSVNSPMLTAFHIAKGGAVPTLAAQATK